MKKGTSSPKEKAPSSEISQDNYTMPKDTNTAKQQDLILKLLESHKQLTTFDFRELGICSPQPRIKELRDKGYPIASTRITCFDHVGVEHSNVALYWLKGDEVAE